MSLVTGLLYVAQRAQGSCVLWDIAELPSSGRVLLCCVYVVHFAHPFIRGGRQGRLHLVAAGRRLPWVHRHLQDAAFGSSERGPESGLAGSRGGPVSGFVSPTAAVREAPSSTSSASGRSSRWGGSRTSVTRDATGRCFSRFVSCFYCLVSLDAYKFVIFTNSGLSVFSVAGSTFSVTSKHRQVPRSEAFVLFSSKGFIVLAVTLKSLTRVELVFVCGAREASSLVLSHVDVPFSQRRLLQRPSFPHRVVLAAVLKIGHVCEGLFLRCLFWSIVCMSVCMPEPRCCEIKRGVCLPVLFFLFRIFLAIPGP